jgi:hypothetical protein
MAISTTAPINVAALPLCAQGADGWPSCNPVSTWGAPCYSGVAADGGAVPTTPPAYCNLYLAGGLGLAILLLAPGSWKLAAIAPLAAYFGLPACSRSGCPGTLD